MMTRLTDYVDKIKITEENFEYYDRAERLLRTSFMNCTDDDNFKGYITVDSLESMLEELCDYIDDLEERIEELEDPPFNDLSYPEEEYDRERYYESNYGNED